MAGSRMRGRGDRAALAAVALVFALFPAAAPAQTGGFGSPAQDQYSQPPGSKPPSGKPGREQARPDRGKGRGDRDGRSVAGDGDRDGDERAGLGGGDSRGGGPPLREAEGNRLPFTGLDLSLVVLAGLLLTAAGVALRVSQRTARRRASAA